MGVNVLKNSSKQSKLLNNSKFNAHYLITQDVRDNKLTEVLCKSSIMEKLKYLFTSPKDFIIGVKTYPFDVSKFYNFSKELSYVDDGSQIVKLVEGTEIPFGDVTDTGLYGRLMLTQIGNGIVRIARLNVTRRYNNFMDYAPYTKISMYLPYLGFIDLPVNEVMGKQVMVDYALDIDTGMCTAYISILEDNQERLIMTTSGKIAIDSPIGSTNQYEIMRNNITNSLKIIAGVTGAIAGTGLTKAGGIGLASTSAINLLNANQESASRGSTSGGKDNMFSPTTCFMIITRPNPIAIDNSYNRVKGKPLNEYRTLSTLTGYTIVEDIHLEGFKDATDDEINQIDLLLKNGVHL